MRRRKRRLAWQESIAKSFYLTTLTSLYIQCESLILLLSSYASLFRSLLSMCILCVSNAYSSSFSHSSLIVIVIVLVIVIAIKMTLNVKVYLKFFSKNAKLLILVVLAIIFAKSQSKAHEIAMTQQHSFMSYWRMSLILVTHDLIRRSEKLERMLTFLRLLIIYFLHILINHNIIWFNYFRIYS